MTSSSLMVSPTTPTGNNRRVELAGMDLWLSERIDNIFVYPSEIKIDQLAEALQKTLVLWPLVTGRIIIENDHNYFIEMCDNSIRITTIVDHDLKEWPMGFNVIIEANDKRFGTFIDQVPVNKVLDSSSNEPLLRLKLTHILQSNEWVLGISWYHLLGDAAACLHFFNTLSRYYQGLEPVQLLPVFERRIWREDEAGQSILPIPKQFLNAKPTDEAMKIALDYQLNYDSIILAFSGAQLATLRQLAGEGNITIQDALTAYIIVTLNTYCYQGDDERRLCHTVTVVNTRGISDLIAPQGEASNALFMMISDDFHDRYSLSDVASTVRRSIVQLRDPKELEPAIAAVDAIIRQNVKNKKKPNPTLLPNEFAINSNLKYDWANLVDFGYKDKCRFHTVGIVALYLRVFRLNPVKVADQWLPRDADGAEVSFRLEKDLKEKFIEAWQRDIMENFRNVKK